MQSALKYSAITQILTPWVEFSAQAHLSTKPSERWQSHQQAHGHHHKWSTTWEKNDKRNTHPHCVCKITEINNVTNKKKSKSNHDSFTQTATVTYTRKNSCSPASHHGKPIQLTQPTQEMDVEAIPRHGHIWAPLPPNCIPFRAPTLPQVPQMLPN